VNTPVAQRQISKKLRRVNLKMIMGPKIRSTGLLSVALMATLLAGCGLFPSRGPIQYVTDQKLNREVSKAVERALPRGLANLQIRTFDHYVRFTGSFGTDAERNAALTAARKVSGVRDVLDYTVVGPPGVIPPESVRPVNYVQ
jgi:hypothetical protein